MCANTISFSFSLKIHVFHIRSPPFHFNFYCYVEFNLILIIFKTRKENYLNFDIFNLEVLIRLHVDYNRKLYEYNFISILVIF